MFFVSEHISYLQSKVNSTTKLVLLILNGTKSGNHTGFHAQSCFLAAPV